MEWINWLKFKNNFLEDGKSSHIWKWDDRIFNFYILERKLLKLSLFYILIFGFMKKIIVLFILIILLFWNWVFANNEDYNVLDVWSFSMSKKINSDFILISKKNNKSILSINWKEITLKDYTEIIELNVSDNWKNIWFVWIKNNKLTIWILSLNDNSILEYELDYNKYPNDSRNLSKWLNVSQYWKDFVLKIWEDWQDKVIINWIKSKWCYSITSSMFADDGTVSFLCSHSDESATEYGWFNLKTKQYEYFKLNPTAYWQYIDIKRQKVYKLKNSNTILKTYLKIDGFINRWIHIDVNWETFWPYKNRYNIRTFFSKNWKNYAFIGEKQDWVYSLVKDWVEIDTLYMNSLYHNIDNLIQLSPDWKNISYIKQDSFRDFDRKIYKDWKFIIKWWSITFCENNKLYYVWEWWIYEENNQEPIYKKNDWISIENLTCFKNDLYSTSWYKIYKNLKLDYDDNLDYIHWIHILWKRLLIIWKRNNNTFLISKWDNIEIQDSKNIEQNTQIQEKSKYQKQKIISASKLKKAKKEKYIKTIDEITEKLSPEKWKLILEKIQKLKQRNEVIDYLEAKIYLEINNL